MKYDITYNDIIDILASNGVDLDYVKIELNNPTKIKKELKLLNKPILNRVTKAISKRAKLNKSTSSVQIYTDGSCLENDSKHPGTFALVVILNNKIIFEYSNHNYITTNNEMELSAMIIAAQIGHHLSKLGVRTLIHSDSQYSVNTLFGTWSGDANKHLQEIFNKLNVNRSMVKCEWVRGHSGVLGNVIADKLCEIEYKNIKGYYVTRR